MKNVLMLQQSWSSAIYKAMDYTYFDENGKEYIDMESGIWCASLGHSHPKMIDAIEYQIKNMIHSGTALKPQFIDELAQKLLEKAAIEGKVFFMNTGSEAIDFAITLARLDNKKREITSFTENYLAAYGQVTQIENRIDIRKCVDCARENCSENCAVIKGKIKPDGIFIFDPFCFMRQVIEVPSKLIEILKKELKRKKALLILDEITAGLGRTGKWFGFQHYGLQPDLIVLGKTLGNGYPISAVVMKNKIAEKVQKFNFIYGQSHQNDPLGCRIAKSVLEALENEQLIKKSEEKGRFFLQVLKKELEHQENVIDIRGKGLMLAVELNEHIDVKNVYKRLITKGVVVGISIKYNLINMFPSFTISENTILQVVRKLKESILEEIKQNTEIQLINNEFLSYKY